MPDASPYLEAAYLVFLALVLVYLAIMATRLSRLEKELGELNSVTAERERAREPERMS